MKTKGISRTRDTGKTLKLHGLLKLASFDAQNALLLTKQNAIQYSYLEWTVRRTITVVQLSMIRQQPKRTPKRNPTQRSNSKHCVLGYRIGQKKALHAHREHQSAPRLFLGQHQVETLQNEAAFPNESIALRFYRSDHVTSDPGESEQPADRTR